MRCFVIIGTRAKGSPDFLLNDIPSTSGRLDVLLRALRASLLVSHGVRRDARVYLVLQGDPSAVTSLRIDGAAAKYLRPDDRSLATLIKKALTEAPAGEGFRPVRPGVAVARGGLGDVLVDVGHTTLYTLDETGRELRDEVFDDAAHASVTFVVGDHLGFDATTRAQLEARAAVALCVGPESLHSEDVIALVHNELDRRRASVVPRPPP